MKALCVVILVLFGGALANAEVNIQYGNRTAAFMSYLAENFDSLDDNSRLATVNEFADVILAEVRHLMIHQGLDPMSLPDIHEGFSFKIIIITYHGELDLTKGILQDASTLYRGGDVKIDYTNRILTLDIPLNFKDFMFNFDYSAKLMNLGPTGKVEGNVKDIRVATTLQADFKQFRVKLNNFKVEKTGKISVKFRGNGIIDWIVNILSGVVTGIFKFLVNDITEGIVKKALVAIVDIVNQILASIKPTSAVPIFFMLVKTYVYFVLKIKSD